MIEERWKALYRYWLSKHVDRRPPSRQDIDPLSDLPRLAANLMLLDVEGENYRYRIAGSEVEARAKMTLTGQLIGRPETLPQLVIDWRRALDKARDEQQPGLYLSQLPKNIAAKYVTLVLPLVDRSGQTEKILVGSFYDQYVVPGTRVLGMMSLDIKL